MEIEDPVILKRLYWAVREMNQATRLDEVLEVALETAVSLVNANRGFIMLFDDPYWTSFTTHNMPRYQSVLEKYKPLAQLVMRRGESLLIREKMDDWEGLPTELLAELEGKTAVLVPLKDKNKPMGVLYVDRNREKGHFSAGNVDLLEEFTLQACFITLKTKRLCSEGQFVHSLGHELRTPISMIKGWTELLLAEEMSSMNELQQKGVTEIQNMANRLIKTLNAAFDIWNSHISKEE